MTRITLSLAIVLPAVVAGVWTLSAEEKTHKLTTISMRKMADSLHAVIAAEQRMYVELAVRSPGTGGAVPGHAEMLRKIEQSIQQRGAEFSYTLRSLEPINPEQGPQTTVEQSGLEYVRENPEETYYTEEELGGRSYFTAVYAETASIAACIDCHNTHPRSPRRDLRAGEVMGAIVVRVPLEF